MIVESQLVVMLRKQSVKFLSTQTPGQYETAGVPLNGTFESCSLAIGESLLIPGILLELR